MDPKLLDYYNNELTYLRGMSDEFAQAHPKVARRLGMQSGEIADPYVERMIEAFCFMAARVQLKLDAEFPRFTQRLLEVVYPNYVAPTPSMSVVQLHPATREGDFSHGVSVPRHSVFRSPIAPGEQTACEFRSSQDVTLWPVAIVDASLSNVPPNLPDLRRHLASGTRLQGALRIRLRTTADINFSQIKGLDQLCFYITGDERVTSHLFELVHVGCVASVVRGADSDEHAGHIVTRDAVTHVGLTAGEAQLPASWTSFHGNSLVQEYFAFRQRFYFFNATQLSRGLANANSREAEIILLLDRLPQALSTHVNASRFALFCTPIVNLFENRTDRVEVDRSKTEFHLVPDRTRPLDYEVFSVQRVVGQQAKTASEVVFNPLYHTVHSDLGNYGRYFSVNRERRLLSDNARKYGTRTQYIGTEVYLSLVDQHEAPYGGDIRYLSVDALVTNRDLPRLIPHGTHNDLSMRESVPIERVTMLHPPSVPREPYALGEAAWRLIRQLSFNYIPLADLDESGGGQALRNMLRLFLHPGETELSNQIDALIGSRVTRVARRLPRHPLMVYGRGVNCRLTVDEIGFSGISPYLFGLVLEQYIARHVSINVFTETSLRSIQRGEVATWAPRPGGRSVV
ncbi:type VI secretion system baseplate subunit TssF [Achromobacter arsenitoxydans]|uniref:Type VI secretion protein n=1 Tax=Achromobacter arsenitoxydans SY8 TaxID=477184 RepID=H0FER3_9BURK|nr:type VI secretion system baseplate subunit TssF [Achromobacter arsenitoxydans]EHK63214.1 type VI secretion protein [Achromobacter arsenitoxydans SY8]